jgi:hypothetical protein
VQPPTASPSAVAEVTNAVAAIAEAKAAAEQLAVVEPTTTAGSAETTEAATTAEAPAAAEEKTTSEAAAETVPPATAELADATDVLTSGEGEAVAEETTASETSAEAALTPIAVQAEATDAATTAEAPAAAEPAEPIESTTTTEPAKATEAKAVTEPAPDATPRTVDEPAELTEAPEVDATTEPAKDATGTAPATEAEAVAQAESVTEPVAAIAAPDVTADEPATAAAVPTPSTIETPAARSRLATTASTFCLIAAVTLWAIGVGNINPAGLTDLGIVSILDWQLWAALPLIAVGFVIGLGNGRTAGPLPFLHLLALVLVLHGTPAVIYETARYSWTWKHIGIVDFIQRHRWVDPEVRFLNAYHNWPGLFLVTAWIADALGTGSIELARAVRFAPPIYNTLFLTALLPVYFSFTGDRRQVYAAGWIFIVGNWIGQDYFSPQATAFFFYLLILGLCLGPLRRNLEWTQYAANPLTRTAAWLAKFFSRGTMPPPSTAGALTKMASVVAFLVLTTAIAVTHQLTPLALIASLVALAAIGRLNISYAIIALVIEVCWLLYFATPFVADHLVQQLDAFGQGLAAASERLVDTSVISPGMVWVVRVGRITTVAVGLLAVFGFFRRVFAGRHDGAAAVLAGTPIFLFANSYGGEILFRVYFFALPFLAFFGAGLFFPTLQKGRSWITRPMFGIIAVLLAVGFMFGNDGKDREYTFTAAEVEAAEWLYETAPPHTLLIEGARGYPSQFLNYENFTYVPISNERKEQLDGIIADPAGTFARWLSDPQWKAGYIIITRSQKAYSDAEGVMPRGTLDRIEQVLLASPRFIVVHSTADAKIFALHPTVGVMGPWAQ